MAVDSTYEYSGYLSTVLFKPDRASRDAVEAIVFGPEDLAKWRAEDFPFAIECREVPVRKSATGDGVHIEGDFRNVLNIESLSKDDPRYWVALSTVGLQDPRLPIDTERYPIIEVTYRCTSEQAHPCWLWSYTQGSHFGAMPKSQQWHTVAHNMTYFGFPKQIENVVLRLYSATRSIESMEIAEVRFRAMTSEEREATEKSLEILEPRKAPRHFDVLEDFMPLGVYMDADSAKRLARMLGISPAEYWEFALEDIAMQHHNAVALANADRLSPEEWKDLLSRFEAHNVKVLVRHEYPVGGSAEEQERHLAERIRPFADSEAIFARTFSGEPIEKDFQSLLEAKERIEEADPNHPVAIVARYPNAYPLFAPFFSASGIGHFTTRRPWDMGKTVRCHEPLARPQQFWAAAPAFMYPTQTPEWSTCPEMRLMVNLSFANGARGWFAYAYHNDPVWLRGMVQRTLTGPFLTFSDLWLELAQRMKRISALAPLFLQARAEDGLEDWFTSGVTTDTTTGPAENLSPMDQFHLRGPDFSLYLTVSNNTRGMTSVNIDIPDDVGQGRELIDLSNYLTTMQWEPLIRKRHLEMFPGQSHIVLVTESGTSELWRDQIAERLIRSDLKRVDRYFALAKAYGLKVGAIENRLNAVRKNLAPESLGEVHLAKDDLVDLIYADSAIYNAQSILLEASAAICGCDGGLCRLMVAGKRETAERIGQDALPLARELMRLRVEFEDGNGARILDSCKDLQKRATRLLARIRGEYPRQRYDAT